MQSNFRRIFSMAGRALGFANAIGVAVDMAANGFNDILTRELASFSAATPSTARAAAS